MFSLCDESIMQNTRVFTSQTTGWFVLVLLDKSFEVLCGLYDQSQRISLVTESDCVIRA